MTKDTPNKEENSQAPLETEDSQATLETVGGGDEGSAEPKEMVNTCIYLFYFIYLTFYLPQQRKTQEKKSCCCKLKCFLYYN